MHISIILVNYNSDEYTIDCLDSLLKIKTPGFKHTTIVVDNASTVPLVLPKRHLVPTIELIRSESNLGFTGGNNMGIHYGVEKFNSDYVLLLNNDTTVDPNFLKELLNHAESHPKAGITTSKIYFTKGREFHIDSYDKKNLGKVLWYAGGSVDWDHLVAFHRGVDEVDRGQFDNQLECDFATGCTLMIKREVLEKIGTLDKKYFLYMEDVEYSIRAKKAGYEVHFVPNSIVWHKNAGSTGGSGSPLQQYYQSRNTLLFTIMHGSWKQMVTVIRLALRFVFTGTKNERRAVFHLLTARFGKQPII
jgi:GT2 family glycosyltransferase